MADQYYKVVIGADTKSAEEKIGAVQNSLDDLTKTDTTIKVNVDANAIRRSVADTEAIANNIRRTSVDVASTSRFNIVSQDSVNNAIKVAASLSAANKDVKGLQNDLLKVVQNTNLRDIMSTDKVLDKLKQVGTSRTKQFAEAYGDIRSIPGVDDLLEPVEMYGRAFIWEKYGSEIADATLKGVQDTVKQRASQIQEGTKNFFYGEVVNDLVFGANTAIDSLARLGLAIQGVQLLVGPLAQAWGAAFDSIIGQNVRLQQTILSTQTTLASTGRFINNSTGEEITDPLTKIDLLAADVTKAIDNIRIRSLDLAGVTSQQIIDIFGIVATSISQIGGDIKDAEDLAVSFTAALGTLGVPLYQANQEISSILSGSINEDSILAKRLQITNADINRARNDVDGVVGYLQKKLEIAVSGQAISAKSFSGITSNIQEVVENIGQRIGAPLLTPLLSGLQGVYNFLKTIKELVAQIGEFTSKLLVKTLKGLSDIFSKSKVLQSLFDGVKKLTEPFRTLEKSIELGLDNVGINLIDEWVNGLAKVPPALQAVVNGFVNVGNFIKLQLDLITGPLLKLLDQTREKATGAFGFAQGIARAPQALIGEGVDGFTKGWDTLSSTVEAAGRALSKFIAGLAKLKITEFTASVRAAATVFELFGNILLGKINLALTFFETVGDLASTELAKFIVSMHAINKLIQQSEFFGLKPILLFFTAGKGAFQQLIKDFALFGKGFKDAGNIDKYVKNMLQTQADLVKTFANSANSIQANAAKIKLLREELDKLRAAQKVVVNNLTNVPLSQELNRQRVLAQNAELIKKTTAELREASKAQKEFSLVQRASSALGGLRGNGAEIAAATQASREAALVASGAAARQAMFSAFTTVGKKLGLDDSQLKGLAGAFNIATRSVAQFITVSLGINLAFAAIGLVVSGIITYMQRLEEAEQRRRNQAKATADVNRILASSYASVLKAAEGGDLAAQQRLEDDRSDANAAYQLELEKRVKLLDEEQKINERINKVKRDMKNSAAIAEQIPTINLMDPGGLDVGSNPNVTRRTQEQEIKNAEKERLKILEKQAVVSREIYRIREAQAKLQESEKLQQDFKIIGQRRLDLEKIIKTAREDYEKEVADKEFQNRMDILSIEQQKRREIQQQELNALQQRFSLLADNATDQDRKIIELVRNYETALLEAANNEGNRRAELAMKEAQMRKQIEDYAFKMAREKANIERQVGAYIKEVENWKARKQKERFREELNQARRIGLMTTDSYGPYDLKSQQQFTNAALNSQLYKVGWTTDQILAAFQLFSKQSLGISSSTDPNLAITKLTEKIAVVNNGVTPIGGLRGLLETSNYTPEFASKYYTSLLQDARNRLNNSSYYESPQKVESLKEPNLNIDWKGLQNRVDNLADSFLNAQKAFDEALALGDRQKLLDALNAFSDPSKYTSFKSDYTSEKLSSLLSLNQAVSKLKNTPSNTLNLEDELVDVRTKAESALRTSLLTLSKGIIDLPGEFLYDTIYDAIIAIRGVTDSNVIDKKRNELMKNLKITDQAMGERFIKIFYAIFEGAAQAYATTRKTFKDRVVIAQGKVIESIVEQVEQLSQSIPTEKYDSLFSTFRETQSSLSSDRYSRASEMQKVDDFITKFIRDSMLKIPVSSTGMDPALTKELNESFDRLTQRLTFQVTAQEEANIAVENFALRTQAAAQATNAVVEANKTFLTSLLSNSSSLKDATQSLVKSISDQFISMFADYTLRPMRDQIMNMFRRVFGVNSAEERAQQALQNAQDALLLSQDALKRSIDTLNTTFERAVQTTPSSPIPGTSSTIPEGGAQTPGQQALERANTDAAARLNQQAQQTSIATKKGFDYGKALQGATQGLASVAMTVSGIQQMKEGGTYNTLMGLASIFGGISSVAGMFTPGGVFGKRAVGGHTVARRPYLVGEHGPEIFTPDTSGEITSAPASRALLESRNSLGGRSSSPEGGSFDVNHGALATTNALLRERQTERTLASSLNAPQSMSITYESQVINNVEYVTIDQFQRGLSDAAERGRALTLGALKNNITTRRRIGV